MAGCACVVLIAASCGGDGDVTVASAPTPTVRGTIAPTPTVVESTTDASLAYDSIADYVAEITTDEGPTIGPLAVALAEGNSVRYPCPFIDEPFGAAASPLIGSAQYDPLDTPHTGIVVDQEKWGYFAFGAAEDWAFYREFGEFPFGGAVSDFESPWAREAISSADGVGRAIALDVGPMEGGGSLVVVLPDDMLAASYEEIDMVVCIGFVRGDYVDSCEYGTSVSGVSTTGISVDSYSLDVRIDSYESLTGQPIDSAVVTGAPECVPSLSWDAVEGPPDWMFSPPPLSSSVKDAIVASLSG